MKQVLVNGRIFDGDRVIEGRDLVIADGKVVELVAEGGSWDVPLIDLEGRLVAPGLVDIQVNGGGGVLFNDAPDVETLHTMIAAHRAFGTTAFLPTLISDDADVIESGIAAVRQALAEGVPGVVGIHIEGPHLNRNYCGVHDATKIRPLDEAAMELLMSLHVGRTLVTIAPEKASGHAIRRLVESGVIVFGGHSGASYEEVKTALDAGLSGFTHLFNAMSPWQHRAPGMVGAALEDEDSYFGIIADGFHLHPATLRLAVKTKATGKALLVTDAMPSVGATEKSFVLNGETIVAEAGRCVTSGGTLAGADIGMIEAVRYTAAHGGVDVYEALRMGSRYPAHAIGLGDTLGSIRPGFAADLVELDDEFNVVRSWIGGDAVEY